MFIWINAIKKAYPYIDNKDIKIVLEIKKPTLYEEMAEFNWHKTMVKQYLKSDIEELFGKMN